MNKCVINKEVLRCIDVHKTYQEGPEDVTVLQGVELSVRSGERVAIVGSSGSGKTTLLNMLGGLDLPSKGEIQVGGETLAQLSERKRGQMRNRKLGFVYQFHHLLSEFTASENVAMPLLIRGVSRAEAQQSAETMLTRVGLGQRAQHKPAELSGGERQRVAIARALVTDPACVLMDEPTGNLDQTTAQHIQQMIVELAQGAGTGFVIVTHDLALARQQDRILQLNQGRLEALAL